MQAVEEGERLVEQIRADLGSEGGELAGEP